MRIKSLKLISLFVIATLSCLLCPITFGQEKETSLNEKRDAERAWEALVRTKGGREKLHSLTNMLREFAGSVRLDIFPNRQWEFGRNISDLSPVVSIADGVKGVQVYTRTFGENGETSENGVNHDDLTDWFPLETLPFLLETKWNKPELLRVREIKEGKKKLDLIETIIGKERVNFIFEPEELLVSKVEFYYQGKVWQTYTFLNYTTIDGIKMPQAYRLGSILNNFNDKIKPIQIKFTFNVEYDPQLFERPLIATTPDAWKPKP